MTLESVLGFDMGPESVSGVSYGIGVLTFSTRVPVIAVGTLDLWNLLGLQNLHQSLDWVRSL